MLAVLELWCQKSVLAVLELSIPFLSLERESGEGDYSGISLLHSPAGLVKSDIMAHASLNGHLHCTKKEHAAKWENSNKKFTTHYMEPPHNTE